MVSGVVLVVAGLGWWQAGWLAAPADGDKNAIATAPTVSPQPFLDSPTPTDRPTVLAESTVSPVVQQLTLIATMSGQTVEGLLTSSAQVEFQDFGTVGKFVKSINGLASDDHSYWALYVNGEYSQTGVSQTVLRTGDVVDFVYEEVDAAAL